jgi:hypothetical protein
MERAERAMEFVRSAGYPSEKEAIHLVTDGNTGDDIRRGFKIFGRPAAAITERRERKRPTETVMTCSRKG